MKTNPKTDRLTIRTLTTAETDLSGIHGGRATPTVQPLPILPPVCILPVYPVRPVLDLGYEDLAVDPYN